MKKKIVDTIKEQINHLFGACGYSLSGARYCLRETAFRQEMCLGVVVVPLIVLLPLSFGVRLLLLSLWVLMLVIEALNTAIEAVVDLAAPGIHELAKKAKDCGSAALGLVGILNCIVWFFVIVKITMSRMGMGSE